MIKDFSDPRHKPITADDVRRELAEQQRREEEERLRPLREAESGIVDSLKKLRDMGIKAFNEKKPDPEWELPASAAGLSMSSEKAAREFNSEAAVEFADKTPDYYTSDKNYATMCRYLMIQKVGVATPECWRAAYERLRSLGLLEERPSVPDPKPVKLTEPKTNPDEVKRREREEYRTKIVVTDPRTGQGFTQYQLDHTVSADEFKRLMIGEFRNPVITDVISPSWARS